jgi:hypothetical protein
MLVLFVVPARQRFQRPRVSVEESQETADQAAPEAKLSTGSRRLAEVMNKPLAWLNGAG